MQSYNRSLFELFAVFCFPQIATAFAKKITPNFTKC